MRLHFFVAIAFQSEDMVWMNEAAEKRVLDDDEERASCRPFFSNSLLCLLDALITHLHANE